MRSQCSALHVLAARLRIRAPEREVQRPADLLVEEDRPDRPVDPEVRADADLAQRAWRPRRSRARGRGRPARARRGADTTTPSRNSSSTSGDLDARRARRGRRSARARWPTSSCGPVKTSPEGMLRLPSELIHVAALHAELQGRPGRLDRAASTPSPAADERVLERAQLAPGRDGVGLVEEQRALDERAEVAERHARLLRVGLRRPQRRGPAALQRLRRARGDGLARRGRWPQDRPRSARACSPAPGSTASRRRAWPPRSRTARRGRVEVLGVAVEVRASRRAARCAGGATRRGCSIARCSSSSSGAASVVERTRTCCCSVTSRQ